MSLPTVGESGMVLAVVVVILIALGVLAHGTLLLARQEFAATHAGMRVLQADAAAEAAVRGGLEAPPPPGLAQTPLWERAFLHATRLGIGSGEAWLRRLSRENWVLEGRGGPEPGVWWSSDSRLVWVMDPMARVGAFQGVVEVGAGAPVEVLGSVDNSQMARDGSPLDPGPCRPWTAVLDSLFAGRSTPPAVTFVDMEGKPEPTLGLLDAEELARRMPSRVAGIGTPTPRETLGRCETENPWNWGDPHRPERPCGGHWVGASGEGDLRVEGGVGQGVLVVLGDLEMAGTRFDGVLLVGGTLRLLGGAWVVGLTRASGGIELDAESAVFGSGCRALVALDALAPVLQRPVVVPGGRTGPR